MTETNALISINGTLVVQLVSFIVFVYLLNRVMFRPLMGVIDERNEYVERIKKDIEDSEKEIETLNITVKQKESAVRDKANEMRIALEDEGGYEASRIFTAVKEEIGALTEKTQAEIDATIDTAKQSLRDEAEILANAIMEKILDRRLGK